MHVDHKEALVFSHDLIVPTTLHDIAHYYNKMTDLFEKFDAKQNLFTTIEELKKAIDDVNSIAQEEKEIDNSAYDWIINQISCDIKSGNLYKD